jgi:RNA polymerase sigma factor (sigma-70 family)
MRDRVKELVAVRHWDDAFALLYGCLHKRVQRFIRSRWAAAPVDDVSQVVWLAVRGAFESFRFEAEPETWVFGIARRKIIDAQRKRQEAVVSSPDSSKLRWSDRLTDSNSPFGKLLYSERAKLIRQVISDWKEEDRLLFEMRFFADLDPAEIADTFDPPKKRNTVTKRLTTLVIRLREELAAITSVSSP